MDSHLGRGGRPGHTLFALVAIFVCSLALAACGSDGESGGGGSDEDQVREIAEQLVNDDPAVCGRVTDDFLKQIDSTKEECEKSDEPDEGPKVEVEEVTVDGDTAEAIVLDEDRTTLGFVKEGDDWLLDSADVEEGAGTSSDSGEETTPEETETEAPADSPPGGDEVDAQAAVDAFLLGAKDEDPAVLCGLLSERYAKQLTGAEFGVAECLSALKQGTLGRLKKGLAGVTVQDTVITDGGRAAGVMLSNGNQVLLKYQDGRFVIDEL